MSGARWWEISARIVVEAEMVAVGSVGLWVRLRCKR